MKVQQAVIGVRDKCEKIGGKLEESSNFKSVCRVNEDTVLTGDEAGLKLETNDAIVRIDDPEKVKYEKRKPGLNDYLSIYVDHTTHMTVGDGYGDDTRKMRNR